MHQFGEVDYSDSLGGDAFRQAVAVHRMLSGVAIPQLLESTADVQMLVGFMMKDLLPAVEQDELAKELNITRDMIHMAALRGLLGKGSKEYFDPSAIVTIE